MEKSVELEAPCKINIHLRVLGKREDGFHDLESIFQAISLCDRVTVSRTDTQGECRIDCPDFDLPDDNTVSRAVMLFREKTGITAGIHILLDKQIPAGAGLGGGSSDAAATLTALNRLFSAGLDAAALHEMACKIGSDVPFFLGAAAALVTGRGENLVSIPSRTDVFGVLIWPGVHCSTGLAYTLVDSWQESHPESERSFPGCDELVPLYRGPRSSWRRFGNSFTAPVEERYPVIRDVKEDLYRHGAFYAEMSGSGSSVFGLFRDEKEADSALTRLSTCWDVCRKFFYL